MYVSFVGCALYRTQRGWPPFTMLRERCDAIYIVIRCDAMWRHVIRCGGPYVVPCDAIMTCDTMSRSSCLRVHVNTSWWWSHLSLSLSTTTLFLSLVCRGILHVSSCCCKLEPSQTSLRFFWAFSCSSPPRLSLFLNRMYLLLCIPRKKCNSFIACILMISIYREATHDRHH